MKNFEIKQHLDNVVELVNYCTENKVKYTPLIMGLLDNFDLLKVKVDNFGKCVSKELIELEQKITNLAKENKSKLSDEEQKEIINNFQYGITFLSDKEKEQYKVLMEEYNVQLNEEIEFELVKFELTKEDFKKFDMDVQHILVLKNYIKN